MIYLRQSTASQEVPLGRFVDSTDGNTEKTALTIANTDIKLWKTGATTLASKNSGGATHIANGEYYCVLDATDTDTIGPMKICIHVAGALYVQVWCTVLDEAVYDAVFGTVALATATNITAATGIDVTKWLGTTVSTPTVAGVPNVNTKTWNDLATVALPLVPTTAGRTLDVAATGEAGLDFDNIHAASGATTLTNIRVPNVTLVDTLTTYASNTPQTGDSYARIGANGVSLSAIPDLAGVTTLLSRLSATRAGYLDNLSAGAVALEASLQGLITTIGASAAGVATAVWAAATRTLTAASDSSGVTTLLGKFTGMTSLTQWLGLLGGKQSGNSTARTELRATGGGSGTFDETTDSLEAIRDSGGGAPTVGQIADAVWDEAIAGHLSAGSTGLALSNAGAAGDPLSSAVPGAYSVGTAGYRLGHLEAGHVTVASAVSENGRIITISQADDLKFTAGTHLAFQSDDWSMVDKTVTLYIHDGRTALLNKAASIVDATSCYVELTSAQTGGLVAGKYTYGLLQVDAATLKETLLRDGVFNVLLKTNLS